MYERIESPQLIKNLGSEDIDFILSTLVSLANYGQEPSHLSPLPDRAFDNNIALWSAVLRRELRANVTVKLERFMISEWFPRSPGLFYTDEAAFAREDAMNFIESVPLVREFADLDDASRVMQSKAKLLAYKEPDITFIFNPYGKISMLKGGVGSVRLRCRDTREGAVWFMSASSSRTAHEGFPLAVQDYHYQKYIERIQEGGFLLCDLIGKLRYLPEDLSRLYIDYTGVPQLYLYVEEIRPLEEKKISDVYPFRVSVAVTFESEYEGESRMYASYVTFYPGIRGSMKSRIEWLEGNYVKGEYNGRIVTDFDETERPYSYSVFSLDKPHSCIKNMDEK
jgi:hypothetical protein